MIEDLARRGRGDPRAPARLGDPASLSNGQRWGDDDPEGGKSNPWSGNGRGGRRGRPGQPSLEELIRLGRGRFGGRLPGGGARPIWGYALAAFVLLWLLTTSFHQIDPQERGVITRFGRYQGTLGPGVGLTMPAPVDVVTRVNVDQIASFDVPGSGGQNLVLTGDQNIIDLAYSVRWSVRDPELYLFELAQPEDTIREVAESAMREEVSRVTLDEAIGPMRSQIESRVAARMQALLDRYRAGVTIEGVAIKQADPPEAVNDAFKEVSAAQQQAQSFLNNARAYSEQVEASASAAAAAFDKVYDAYRLAPEVTRKRMYYETMEAVLARNDKVIVDTPGSPTVLPLPGLKPRGRAVDGEPPTITVAPAPVTRGGGQ
ncbi:FtsH protease activity modulator HflK [Sphingomonas morindae]|uniref:Protein HflK n=1 Tax=Sphingomonas morindae TaxID=1541170 RepID=A0ABY4X5W1_9SPHN|nr:FtsH protease activity modulator HflK [Sphingomonas morindae]USI72282.1 FtsH protease activity modulator HflK [Sphingomonas morindae]